MTFYGFRPQLIEFLDNLGANNKRECLRPDPARGIELEAAIRAVSKRNSPRLCFEHYGHLAPLQQWLVDILPE